MVAVDNGRGGPEEVVDENTPLRIPKNDDNKVQRHSSYQSIQQSSSSSSSFTSESVESSRSDAEGALLPRPDSADNEKTLANIISVTLVLLLGMRIDGKGLEIPIALILVIPFRGIHRQCRYYASIRLGGQDLV